LRQSLERYDRCYLTELFTEPLEPDDIESVDSVFQAAYGVSGSREVALRRMCHLAPDGAFVAKSEGEIIGLISTINYLKFGYIGMLGVLPKARGKGAGQALMRRSVNWLLQQGIRAVLLDATDLGKPLYTKMGFAPRGETQFWQRLKETKGPGFPTGARLWRPGDNLRLASLDASIFGGDRVGLLSHFRNAYPERSFVSFDNEGNITGFMVVQEKMLGPWCAASPEGAASLLEAALTLKFDGQACVIIPVENAEGIQLLKRSGFILKRSCEHMSLGPEVSRQLGKLYGQASFALG